MDLQRGASFTRAVWAAPCLSIGKIIGGWKKNQALRAAFAASHDRHDERDFDLRKRAGLAVMSLMLAFGWTAPAFAQAKAKPVVAVTNMEDIAQTGQAAALITMIRTAVSSTGKFHVIERDFSELDSERALQQAGRVTSNRGGRGGPVAEGVDYIISGSITSASGGQASDGGTNAARVFGGAMLGLHLSGDCHRAENTLAVDVKIVNVKTGEIAFAKQITQHAVGHTSCSGAAGFDMTSLLRDVANQTAAGLTLTMYPIKLAAIQPDGTFFLNYGEGFVTVGEVLSVHGQGVGIPDPDTGVIMTSEGDTLGIITVTEVTTRYSKGLPVVAFSAPPPVGSVVSEATPADMAKFNPRGHGRHH